MKIVMTSRSWLLDNYPSYDFLNTEKFKFWDEMCQEEPKLKLANMDNIITHVEALTANSEDYLIYFTFEGEL